MSKVIEYIKRFIVGLLAFIGTLGIIVGLSSLLLFILEVIVTKFETVGAIIEIVLVVIILLIFVVGLSLIFIMVGGEILEDYRSNEEGWVNE